MSIDETYETSSETKHNFAKNLFPLFSSNMSGRRQQKSAHKHVLERLRAQREGGTSALQDYEVKDDEKVYDEVNEADYQLIMRRRLQDEPDFVVDDDGLGYVDYGEDEWDRDGSGSDSMSGGSDTEANKHAAGKFC